ncbi:MAG: cytochrome c [Bacteroidota bacterium]
MKISKHWMWLLGAAGLSACGAGGNDPGVEYAPNMYHSVPYEPLSQITDKSAGAWVNSTETEGLGEYYSSNPNNPHGMNMREPVAGTVRRNKGYLPYRIPADSLEYAGQVLVSPLDSAMQDEILANGKELYLTFCEHCHGAKGAGDGLVAEKYPGVANLTTPTYANHTEGKIFHVITHGKGNMQPHGSQISQEDRWKIARYVRESILGEPTN